MHFKGLPAWSLLILSLGDSVVCCGRWNSSALTKILGELKAFLTQPSTPTQPDETFRFHVAVSTLESPGVAPRLRWLSSLIATPSTHKPKLNPKGFGRDVGAACSVKS